MCPKCSQLPKQNASFWSRKLTSNVRRDKRIRRALNRAGFRVIRLWEHDLERISNRCKFVLSSLQKLSQQDPLR
jgi:DNA mismatch endonuclease (patch repair protein)